jgi:hypothetical protein
MIDSETGEPYEARFTKADYAIGGLWCIVGVFGLILAHIEGQIRRWGGH